MTRLARLLITLTFVTSSLLVGCAVGARPAAGGADSEHYVSASGTATWAQALSSETPCSLSTAIANYAAGDTVTMRAGTYAGRPTFSRSGAAGNPVTVQPYPGEKVVFSEGFTVSGSYLAFNGGGGRLDPSSLGFVVTPGSQSNSKLAGQIAINGSNNTVAGFWVYNCDRGSGVSFSDSASITGNTISNFVIGDARVFDGINVQYDGVNIGRNVSNTTIRDFDISGFGGTAGITSNQMALGSGKGVLIEDGYIHGPAGWYMGDNVSDGDGVRFCGPNMTMRRVVIDIWQEYDHNGTGVKHSDAIMAYTGTSQGPDNLLIEECRFGSMNTTHSWDKRHSLGLGCSSNNSDGKTRTYNIKNCVWLMAEPSDPTVHGVWSYSGGAGLTINFDNCYFKGGSPSLPGKVVYKNCVIAWPNNRSLEVGRSFTGSSNNAFVGYSSLPTWAKSQPGSFVTSDPKLVNANFTSATRYGLDADLHPAAGSPLIDAGTTASTSPAIDLAGNARTGTMDIGPYTYDGPGIPPISSFLAAPSASVALSWVNPGAPDFEAVRILRSTTGFATSPTATAGQQIIYEGAGTAFTDHPTARLVTYYTAYARSTAGVWSTRACVLQDPATRLVTPSSFVVGYTEPGVIRVRLLDANGRGLNGKAPVVQRSDGLQLPMTAVTAPGTASGTYAATVATVGDKRTTFTISYAGDEFLKPSAASTAVMPRAHVGTPVARKTMSRLKYYSVRGRLLPRHAAGTYPVRIYKWKKTSSGKWKSFGYVNARAYDGSGYTKYSRKMRLKYRGTWRLRAYAPADSGHAAAWSSGYDYVKVK